MLLRYSGMPRIMRGAEDKWTAGSFHWNRGQMQFQDSGAVEGGKTLGKTGKRHWRGRLKRKIDKIKQNLGVMRREYPIMMANRAVLIWPCTTKPWNIALSSFRCRNRAFDSSIRPSWQQKVQSFIR